MVITFLEPLHARKGRSIAQALRRSTDYVKNPDKTDNGEWISAYQCNPSIVDAEFLYSKRQYAAYTGKSHKLPKKKQAEFYEAHRSDIMLHEAAKHYFDSLELEKLPSIKDLKQEYAAENKQLWPEGGSKKND